MLHGVPTVLLPGVFDRRVQFGYPRVVLHTVLVIVGAAVLGVVIRAAWDHFWD